MTRSIVELDMHCGGDLSIVDRCQTSMLKVATCSDDTTVKVWHANRTLLDHGGGGGARDEVAMMLRDPQVGKKEGYGVSQVVDLDEQDDEAVNEGVDVSNVDNDCCDGVGGNPSRGECT